jgi:hypothetical protein
MSCLQGQAVHGYTKVRKGKHHMLMKSLSEILKLLNAGNTLYTSFGLAVFPWTSLINTGTNLFTSFEATYNILHLTTPYKRFYTNTSAYWSTLSLLPHQLQFHYFPFTYLFRSSTVLQRPWQTHTWEVSQVIYTFGRTVLRRVMRPSQRSVPIHDSTTHKHACKHPCLEWDLSPRTHWPGD